MTGARSMTALVVLVVLVVCYCMAPINEQKLANGDLSMVNSLGVEILQMSH